MVYSQYAGTELEVEGERHVLLKVTCRKGVGDSKCVQEEDVVGVLKSEDISKMQPLGDRILVKVYPSGCYQVLVHDEKTIILDHVPFVLALSWYCMSNS